MAEVTKIESKLYRRLPGLRLSGGRSALRIADDHLLLCDYRTGFTDRYKRFYFRDIEAIIVRRTLHWAGSLMVWGFIALCFFLIATSTHWNIFLYVLEGICVFFMARNLIRGRSCRTHIQTAVQIDVLPPLKRVRRTKRILRSLFPLIEQAQGKREGVAPTSAIPIPPSAPTSVVSPAVTPVSVFAKPVTVQRALSWFHVFAFTLALLSGLIAIWEVNDPSNASLMVLTTLFCLSTLGSVLALVRQARRRVHPVAGVMTWLLVIGSIIGALIVNGIFTMVDALSQAKIQAAVHSRGPMIIHPLTPFRLRHMPGFDNVLWVYGVVTVIAALVGLIFVFMPAPATAQPPPLPGGQRE
jgi:hypothetical protein